MAPPRTWANCGLKMKGARSRLIPNLLFTLPRKWPKSMWNRCPDDTRQSGTTFVRRKCATLHELGARGTKFSDHDIVIVSIANAKHVGRHAISGTAEHEILLCRLELVSCSTSMGLRLLTIVSDCEHVREGFFCASQLVRVSLYRTAFDPPLSLFTEAVVEALSTTSIIPSSSPVATQP